jgi:uncharacterized protein YndB with AHSA1/START domain
MSEVLPPIAWQTYIDVPPQRVFATLTTAVGWDAWFTTATVVDLRLGGTLTLRWVDAAKLRHRVTLWGRVHADMEVACRIVAVEPNRRFAFEWSTAGHPTTVDFGLAARGEGTVVTLTEAGYLVADLGATGMTGQVAQRSPFAMCASGWGEALTLLKFWLEHGITYGQVPPAT